MAGEHSFPIATSDGLGGGIFFWEGPGRDGYPDLYAQRIDASGAARWGSNGIGVVSAPNGQYPTGIVPDEEGGALVSWVDGRDGGFDLYMQRISAAGQPLWASNGVALARLSGGVVNFASMISDGTGGAVLAWEDYRNYFGDIFAQRVNALGIAQWTSNGVALTSMYAQREFPSLAADGTGGGIVAWEDHRSDQPGIYAGRVDSHGAVVWGIDGVPVCTAPNLQMFPHVASDDAGGAIIAWEDGRNLGISDGDIYCQRLDPAGAPIWATNGVPVCTASNYQVFPVLVPDGNHGAIIVWGDQRMGAGGLYAQGVDSTGLTRWTSNGVLVTVSPYDDANTRITSDGAGGTIIVWADGRNADNSDVYASRLSPPVADAGGPYHGIAGVPVSFDGLGSVDPGGDVLFYSWDFGDGSSGTGAQPTHVYATNGQYSAVLSVTDGVLSDSAVTTVTISSPLNCSHATAVPALLWPPNHQLVPVMISGIAQPGGQPVSINITRVTQNEPSTGGDVIILQGGAAALRAERAGRGNGRVYTIWFTATAGGTTCDGSVEVCVPHDETHSD
jgi:hypothetical protein